MPHMNRVELAIAVRNFSSSAKIRLFSGKSGSLDRLLQQG
jgi:hypothetical protein